MEERVRMVADCIREQGFGAEAQGIALIVDAGSSDQVAASERAEAECWDAVEAQYPPAPESSPAQRYGLLLEQAECLEGLGYQIPDPPGQDAWIEANARNDDDLWSPVGALGGLGREAIERIQTRCPALEIGVAYVRKRLLPVGA